MMEKIKRKIGRWKNIFRRYKKILKEMPKKISKRDMSTEAVLTRKRKKRERERKRKAFREDMEEALCSIAPPYDY